MQEDLHQRAWAAGARLAGRVVKLDLDSTMIETYGLRKQGGKGFTYLNTRGYHPLLAVKHVSTAHKVAFGAHPW